jgi:hypothetical protein
MTYAELNKAVLFAAGFRSFFPWQAGLSDSDLLTLRSQYLESALIDRAVSDLAHSPPPINPLSRLHWLPVWLVGNSRSR